MCNILGEITKNNADVVLSGTSRKNSVIHRIQAIKSLPFDLEFVYKNVLPIYRFFGVDENHHTM